jgi:hypothetical protein
MIRSRATVGLGRIEARGLISGVVRLERFAVTA